MVQKIFKQRLYNWWFATLNNSWETWTYVAQKYVHGYNHISEHVLGDSSYSKIVCYSLLDASRRVVVDQGWIIWLAPLFALKRGLKFDISQLVTSPEDIDIDNDAPKCVYELTRGKGSQIQIVLTRGLNIESDILPLPHESVYRIVSACVDDGNDGNDGNNTDFSITRFVQDRLGSFDGDVNRFTTKEVVMMAALSMNYNINDINNIKNIDHYKITIVLENPNADSVQTMFREVTYEPNDIFDMATVMKTI